MRHTWTILGILAALLLALALPSALRGEEEDDKYLRVFRAELSLEEPDAGKRGYFILELEVTCSEEDACDYAYEVEKMLPSRHTVESGQLDVDEDGNIGTTVRWMIEEEDCGETWEGRVLVTATSKEKGEKTELYAQQHMAVRVPKKFCSKKKDDD